MAVAARTARWHGALAQTRSAVLGNNLVFIGNDDDVVLLLDALDDLLWGPDLVDQLLDVGRLLRRFQERHGEHALAHLAHVVQTLLKVGEVLNCRQ